MAKMRRSPCLQSSGSFAMRAWPQETMFQKRCFELLRAAYVKNRYSRHYRITEEELAYLRERIELLRQLVAEASDRRLAELRAEGSGEI